MVYVVLAVNDLSQRRCIVLGHFILRDQYKAHHVTEINGNEWHLLP